MPRPPKKGVYIRTCLAELFGLAAFIFRRYDLRRFSMNTPVVYEIRPRKDKRGVDLISDALPFRRLWYGGPEATSNAVGYAKCYTRLHDVVVRVFDETGNLVEAHEQAAEFKEP